MRDIYTLSFSHKNVTAQPHGFRHSSAIGLSFGSIHLILGFLSVLLGIVGLVAEFHASKFGSALWSGLIFEVTGATGIIASRRWYRDSYILCFCIASALSAFTGLLLFALTCVGIAHYYAHWDRGQNASVAHVSANVIVLSVIETITSIVSATLAAQATRGRYTLQSRLQSKESVVVRETYMVQGTNRPGSLVPDVVQIAPSTLVTIHHTETDHNDHFQLTPVGRQQILDPNALDFWDSPLERQDSWESLDSYDDNNYYFCRRDNDHDNHCSEL